MLGGRIGRQEDGSVVSADHRRCTRAMRKAGVVPAFVTPFALALTDGGRQRRRARRRGAGLADSAKTAEADGGENLEKGQRQRARRMLPMVGSASLQRQLFRDAAAAAADILRSTPPKKGCSIYGGDEVAAGPGQARQTGVRKPPIPSSPLFICRCVTSTFVQVSVA